MYECMYARIYKFAISLSLYTCVTFCVDYLSCIYVSRLAVFCHVQGCYVSCTSFVAWIGDRVNGGTLGGHEMGEPIGPRSVILSPQYLVPPFIIMLRVAANMMSISLQGKQALYKGILLAPELGYRYHVDLLGGEPFCTASLLASVTPRP